MITMEPLLSLHFLIESTEVSENDQYIKQAARARIAELQTLLSALTGNGDQWQRHLGPITKALDTTFREIETANTCEVYEEGTTPGTIEEFLQDREDVIEYLNQARVTALAMITHLNNAISKIPTIRVP